jgi:hypothetical protein
VLFSGYPANTTEFARLPRLLPSPHAGTMSLIFVNSSAIRAVGYNGYTVAVQFTTSDKVYTHHGVPHSVYAGLMQADSMGAYYSRHIRGRYR